MARCNCGTSRVGNSCDCNDAITVPTGATGATGAAGAAGTAGADAVYAILTRETTNVLADEVGNVYAAWLPQTTVLRLYEGTTEVDIHAYSATLVNHNVTSSSIPEPGGGKGIQVGMNTMTGGPTILTGEITISITYATIVYTKVFYINKIVNELVVLDNDIDELIVGVGGETRNLDASDNGYLLISGGTLGVPVVLGADLLISSTASSRTFTVVYNGFINPNGHTVSFFGYTLSDAQALSGELLIKCSCGATGTQHVVITEGSSGYSWITDRGKVRADSGDTTLAYLDGKVDNSTIEITAGDKIAIKADGVTRTQLNVNCAGDGLTQTGTGALEVLEDPTGSLVVAAAGVKLSGDSAAPGTNMIYGTDSAGTKGWYGYSGILTASATLTANQVKLLHTTPVTLVGAPGADKVIDVISCNGYLDFVTTAYDAGADHPILIYSGSANEYYECTNAFIELGADGYSAFTMKTPIQEMNTALEISASGNLDTLGTGDSRLTIDICYRIVDFS